MGGGMGGGGGSLFEDMEKMALEREAERLQREEEEAERRRQEEEERAEARRVQVAEWRRGAAAARAELLADIAAYEVRRTLSHIHIYIQAPSRCISSPS